MSCANHVVASCSLKQSKSKPLVLHLPSYCPLHSFSTNILSMIYTRLCIFPPLICSNPLSAFCSHVSMETVLTRSPVSTMRATQYACSFSSSILSAQFTCVRSPSLLSPQCKPSPAPLILLNRLQSGFDSCSWCSCCSASPLSFSPSSFLSHHLRVSGPQDLGLHHLFLGSFSSSSSPMA